MPPQTKPIGIDVCSGPTLSRAERLAQEAARIAAPQKLGPGTEQPTSRPPVAE